MNLKDFLANREKPPELYWSVVLEEGWVQAGIWYIGEGISEVISIGPGAVWETEEELMTAADAALSSAIQKLPEEREEPNKTVFGVPASWVRGGEITEEYLSKIKKLCVNLSLTPVGFVVLPESFAHLYKSEEGAPLSAIILGLGKEFLDISVFKMGNLSGTTRVSRSVSLIDDVTEGLTRFEGDSPLPSRILIFDGKGGELDEAKETLLQATWEGSEKVKFLHTPKVEVLPPDQKVLAVSLAGANEIGNISKVNSQEKSELVEESKIEEEVQNIAPASDIKPEDLGFAVNEDVSQEPAPAAPVAPSQPAIQNQLKTDFHINSYIKKAKSAVQSFVQDVLPQKAPTSSMTPLISRKKLTVMALVATILLALGVAFWWFYPKAVVTIYVTPKEFEHEANISFDTNGVSNLAENIVPGELVSETVSGNKTKTTTGTKTIGDKARGRVRVQNGTAFPINITAGSFLVSSANLKFTADESASVSAALSPSSPGTAEVSVTADAIGAEYNLAKDEVFKVGNYPKAEVDAISVADFSGGSSHEISAVAQKDQTDLASELEEELIGQAKSELSATSSPDKIFIDDLAVLDVEDESFDHKVGDEADSIKLSLTLDAKGIFADKSKLLEFARTVLADKVPTGYVLRDNQISFIFTFVDSDEEGGQFNYDVLIKANFLPEVNIDDITSQIVGRTPEITESYLSKIPGFTRAEVKLKPRFPGFLGTLPRIRKNLTVEVVAEH